MAKRKQVQEPEVELEAVTEKSQEQEQEQEYELSQFIAENAESANFAIVYKKASNGQFERIGKYAIASCDLDAIAQEYGGGVFRVRVTTETGQFLKQFTTSYATPKPKPESAKTGDQTLLNMLLSQNQQNQQMLLKAIEVLGTRQQVSSSELKPMDIVQMMTAFKNMTSSTENATETLLRGLEMGLNLGEKAGENRTTVDRVVEALPMLANALSTRKIALKNELKKVVPTQTTQPTQALSEPTGNTMEITPTDAREARIFALLANIRPYIQTAEKNNIPAAMLSSYLAANIDDTTAQELMSYLSQEDERSVKVNVERLKKYLGIGDAYMQDLYVQVMYALTSIQSEETDGEQSENIVSEHGEN
jgi:hypothetical protein